MSRRLCVHVHVDVDIDVHVRVRMCTYILFMFAMVRSRECYFVFVYVCENCRETKSTMKHRKMYVDPDIIFNIWTHIDTYYTHR